MPPFQYTEAQSVDEAVALLSRPGAVAMGGGTDLLPQVKDGVVCRWTSWSASPPSPVCPPSPRPPTG